MVSYIVPVVCKLLQMLQFTWHSNEGELASPTKLSRLGLIQRQAHHQKAYPSRYVRKSVCHPKQWMLMCAGQMHTGPSKLPTTALPIIALDLAQIILNGLG